MFDIPNIPDMIVVWLVVLIVSLIIELFTMGLTTIWFSIGAAVSAILAAQDISVWIQIGAFAIVSVGVMLLARPLAQRVTKGSVTPTNADELIGCVATVLTRIDNDAKTGQIRIRDLEWMARSKDGSVIEAGEKVTIREISGVKLIVSKNTDTSNNI